ncbi:hypothetical protein C5B41_17205, partial [Acinetobacter ursingii]
KKKKKKKKKEGRGKKKSVERKKDLFGVEGFTTLINGLSQKERYELVEFVLEISTQEQCHLRGQWQEGDVAIWDNRCTQHKALFD